MSEEISGTASKDYSYQLAIPVIKIEDVDEHGVQDAYDSSVPQTVCG